MYARKIFINQYQKNSLCFTKTLVMLSISHCKCLNVQGDIVKIHVKDAENIEDHAPDTTLVLHHDRYTQGQPVFWIHLILMWIRIRGSSSGKSESGSGSDIKSQKCPIYFSSLFSVKDIIYFVVIYELVFMCIKQDKKYDIFIIWLIFQ